MDIEFLEYILRIADARKKAVELEGPFDSEVIIEPSDNYELESGHLVINDEMVVSIAFVRLAKIVPTLEEKEEEMNRVYKEFRESMMEVLND